MHLPQNAGVVALGSLLVQVTHTESGPASEVGGQGHLTLGQTGGISRRKGGGGPVWYAYVTYPDP